MKLLARIVIDCTDQNMYTVKACTAGAMVANVKLTSDEALWAVAEYMIRGSSRFLQTPIQLVRQEVHFRGLIGAFGGDF